MALRLILDRLTVDYAATRALDSVSVAYEGGSIVAVFGENGAGKSTLLWAMSGLLLPSSGRRVFESAAAVQPTIGFLAHQSFLFEDLTVEENLKLTAQLYRLPDSLDCVSNWILRMGLEDVRSRRISQLSRGQAQRVAIARAVLPEPEILLLDEPISNLDAAGLRQVSDVIASLRSTERIIVMATHDQALGEKLASHTLNLCDGRIAKLTN